MTLAAEAVDEGEKLRFGTVQSGRLRNGHDHDLWMSIKAEAAERHQTALEQPLPKFYAFDADWEAVKATKQNIIAAGFERVLDQIQIEERTLADWPNFEAEGKTAFIVTNPPYGERLGDKASNRALYLGLSALLQKNFPNQTAAVIAAAVAAGVLEAEKI